MRDGVRILTILTLPFAVAACEPLVVVHDQSMCKLAFCTTVRQQSIDKIDLLFGIDNSASMGDKQGYLKAAIPDLIRRLVQPNCVDPSDPTKVVGQTDPVGSCATGKPEFLPMRDLHIGVVTSSLGSRLGDVCDPSAMTAGGLSRHNDDRGELVNRATAAETAEADMMPSNFLSWFPDVPANAGHTPGAGANPIKDASAFQTDFSDLVIGVHQLGCGIESQLESWYRFLIQPDPYDKLDNPSGRATWTGVDGTIIAQRHDFLRPDSLVAIVVLSDENDSEIDVRALGQQAWHWMSSGFEPPRGTSTCKSDPGDPSCTSCLLAPNRGAGDPNCMAPYSAPSDWGFDMNLRHVHMKEKYGVDVQFPIQRYVNGLTSVRVPNRDGEYPPGKAKYVGTNNCTNPLYAAALPDGTNLDPVVLCNTVDDRIGGQLNTGSRTKDLVFFVHIGGVPHELFHFAPGDTTASIVTDDDWAKIIGKDPLHYDYSGIDPHMIESYKPRAGLPPPSSADDADPIHGREWITNARGSVDLQYACTFPLAAPRNCTDPANAEICDCPSTVTGAHDETPPLCGTTLTQQVRAKAYPTIRELLLARLMGTQGIVASICPIHVNDNAEGSDPLYGYRPAVDALLDRLKVSIDRQCFPLELTADDAGNVPCSILEVLPVKMKCSALPGLSDAPPDITAACEESERIDATKQTICLVKQLVGADLVDGSCTTSRAAGWCYVTGAAAGTCPQDILFSPSGSPVNGATIILRCASTSANCGF